MPSRPTARHGPVFETICLGQIEKCVAGTFNALAWAGHCHAKSCGAKRRNLNRPLKSRDTTVHFLCVPEYSVPNYSVPLLRTQTTYLHLLVILFSC